MGKQPGFFFFPGDWLKDPALRSCGLTERGAWIDLLCFMWESEERGYLVLNSRPMTLEEIANLLHISDLQQAVDIISKLLQKGVASQLGLDGKPMANRWQEGMANDWQKYGKIYSRRLVREEEVYQKKISKTIEIAKIRAEAGQKGASKRWQKRPPSSSSSTSSSFSKEALKSQEPLKNRIAKTIGSMSNGDGKKAKALQAWISRKRDLIVNDPDGLELVAQTLERLKQRENNGTEVKSYDRYLDTLYAKVKIEWNQSEATRLNNQRKEVH